jgi:hypothetical protein
LVAHIDKHGFSHVTVRRNAARHGDFAAFDIISAGGGAGFRGGKFVFERENAAGFQLLKLGFSLFNS